MSDDLTMLGPDGIRRSYDEHYDTVMDVEQDPSGAHQAIQRQHTRIEELEERLKAATDDAKEAEDYVAELEAKLAKAVEALQGLVPILCEGFEDGCGKLSRHDCAACEGYATLAELTGGKDE